LKWGLLTKDYQMAREGILNGEEDYTEEDLGLWE
jgi:hypothetical protein